MLKQSILLNSLVTFVILIINFGFKIYLAREFSQENLVIYYTITDIFSIIGRVFIGYKDALTTIYNQTLYKLKILKTWAVFFTWVISLASFIIIPLIFNFYLVEKISNIQIDWWIISLLFASMNFVAFYGYIFLVTKHYKLISIKDALSVFSLIMMILFLYLGLKMESDYQTLILASIYANIIVLIYLIYKQRFLLPQYGITQLIGFKFSKFEDDTNKRFIKQTIMASSSYFVYGLLLFAPVWIMLNNGRIEELANFQVVARSIFFALISVFSWPLGRFMFPEFSSLIAQKNYITLDDIRKKFIKILSVFGPVIIVSCWLLSEVVISLLFPSEYLESYQMLNILIVTLPFIIYQNFSESIIKSTGNYKINFIIKSSGLISFLISYYFTTAIFNVELAAIYSFLIGFLCIFIFSLCVELNIKKQWRML